MTIHYSFRDSWAMIDELTVGDQGHTSISEYTSGAEQVAELWGRIKRAYDAEIALDTHDNQALIDELLWLKRQLRGQAGRLWVAEKLSEWMSDEYFGTGDGSTKGFLLPAFGTFELSYPKIYDAGVWTDVNGAEGAANLVSEDLALAADEQDWSLTNATGYEEKNYQWLWTDRCTEAAISSTAQTTIEAIAAERVDVAAMPDAAVLYATVALRGDVSNDMKVGIRQYNSTPSSIDITYGTATTISLGEWTLVSSGAISLVSGHDTAGVIIQSDGTLSSADELYIGGVCLSLYPGAMWFDPTTCPHSVQFSTAPTAGNRLSFTARAKRMTRCRLAADNLNHVVDSHGHVKIGRLKMLEVVE